MKSRTIKQNTPLSDIRFLFGLARQGAGEVIVYTVLTAVVSVLSSLVLLFSFPVVLRLTENTVPFARLFAVVVALTASLFVLRWLKRLFDGAFEESCDLFRTRAGICLSKKALTVSYQQAITLEHGEQLSRASQAVGQHIHAPLPHIWRTLSNLLINTVGTTACAMLLGGRYPWLLVVVALAAVLCAVIIHAVGEWGIRHKDEETAHDARLAYTANLSGDTVLSKDIRVFGLASWIGEIRRHCMKAAEAFVNRRARIYFITDVACAVLTLLQNGVAYAVLIQSALTQLPDIPTFLLYFAAVGAFAQWMRGLTTDLLTLHRELPHVEAYRRYLEQEELFTFEGGKKPSCGCPHTLELKNVTFAYTQSDEPVLDHINLTLKAGERLAVVGRDGIGKSTLAKLICGLLDPDEGAVLLDGVDVRCLDRRAYYALFSTVFRERSPLDITVSDMITGGADKTDDMRLWECLEKAGVAQTIRDRQNGLDTCVGQLSGGECQRLLLARALYKNGDILVLDEPTAALDPLAEHALYQEYDRITKGKSAVFVSQRLASTRFCDRIIYLKNGVIAEEGTHEELLSLGGEYAHLFEVQSRYYREGRRSL